jgi:hypothetical protein
MIVVHFVKVSALYQRVVISSLAKRLENLLFFHSYTTFGVWHRDHYILLQRFTMDRMPDLAKVVRGTIAMLRFLRVVRGIMAPLAPCGPERMTMPLSTHLSKAHFPHQLYLVSKMFHTGHVAAPIVLECLLLRLGP